MMEQSKSSAASKGAKWSLARFGRLIVFILSAGFLYPNVLIEGMDLMAMHETNDVNVTR